MRLTHSFSKSPITQSTGHISRPARRHQTGTRYRGPPKQVTLGCTRGRTISCRPRVETTFRQLFWRIAGPNRQQRAVRAGQWKLLVDGGQFLLFDMRADPGEKQDLAAQRPDLVVKLKTLLEAWERDVDQKPQANQ